MNRIARPAARRRLLLACLVGLPGVVGCDVALDARARGHLLALSVAPSDFPPQCDLVRREIPRPFSPSSDDAAWRDAAVSRIASDVAFDPASVRAAILVPFAHPAEPSKDALVLAGFFLRDERQAVALAERDGPLLGALPRYRSERAGPVVVTLGFGAAVTEPCAAAVWELATSPFGFGHPAGAQD